MPTAICDVCGFRPASARITLVRNGRSQTLDVCSVDLARLQQQGPYISPLDALFAGEGFVGNFNGNQEQNPRYRENVDVSQFLSQTAKETIQKAAEVASRFGRSEIDTEHLLFSLSESTVVQEILRQIGLKPKEIQEDIEEQAPKSSATGVEQFTVSPRVKRVLEQSLPIAQELGHGYIGPEHLFISLLDEDEGLAGVLLRRYGLTPESVRHKTMRVVGRGAKEGKVEQKSTTPQLDKYSRDLSKLASTGKLDPVIGRANEIEMAIEILSRRTKNNPVLIGEPGVGKTAIAEGLAQRIVSNEVPEPLLNKRVMEVNLNAMVAGSRYRGEFEERIKAVLDEIIANQDELIIFIDELHTLVGAGSSGNEGGLDASNVIKPALARGELHLIGATTLNEYQKYIEKDAALERRFQPVMVSEPTVEQTIEILRGLRDKYEAYHKVKITDEAVVASAELSDRYITNRFLPDKAIDLIDQASARVRIALSSPSHEVRELEEQMNNLHREQEYASSHKEFDRAKDLANQIAELNRQRDTIVNEWRKQKGVTSAEVKVENIAQVVSRITGVPVTELTQEERARLLDMESRLHERVIGQEQAIVAVSDAVRRARSGLSERNRPLATFLFLGPTGVGKTELAKSLAQVVFGAEDAMTRIDMSEYMERHAVSRLIGAPPGYVGYEEAGQLTEAVRRRPYTVILLDEIEKAHPDVYNVLLQLFDDGRLTDGKGRVIDFSNTVIIATSNLGSGFQRQEQIGFVTAEEEKENQALQEQMLSEVRAHFRPEFINRIDEIIVFHKLDQEQIQEIVRLQLARVARSAHGQNIQLSFADSLVTHLAKTGYSSDYGARELKRQIQTQVENRLAKALLAGDIKAGSTVDISYDEKNGVSLMATERHIQEEVSVA